MTIPANVRYGSAEAEGRTFTCEGQTVKVERGLLKFTSTEIIYLVSGLRIYVLRNTQVAR